MPFVRTALILPFIIYTIHWGFAQDSLAWKNILSENEDLEDFFKSSSLSQYQIRTGISDLILDANAAESQGRSLDAIRKLQLGLFLEKQLDRPSPETFDLNYFAGRLISTIDLHYGLEFYKKATQIISFVPDIDPSEIFTMLTSRAGVHASLNQKDTAVFYFRQAIRAAHNDSHLAEVSSFNNLGVFYHDIAMYDSAKYYFVMSLGMLGPDKTIHAGLYCAILDNLAQLDILEGDYLSAFNAFRHNDSVYAARELHNKYMINKVRKMEVMHKLNIPGIEKEITSLQSFIDDFMIHLKPPDVLLFYRFANDYYHHTGKYEESNAYQERYIQWSDSLSNTAATQMHLLTQSLLSLEEVRFNKEMEAFELAAEKSKLQLKAAQRIIIISLVSGLSIVSLLFLYYRKRKQELSARTQLAETELKNKEMEARLMEKELMLKKRDLTNLVLHNTQIHDSNHKLIDRLQEITHQKEHMEKEVRSLLMELQSQDQVADRSLMLQANIESLNEEFYQKLKSRYPDLTKAEAELCGFIRINLSSKDISILKNVGAPSVKLSKNRLRKKLGINPEEDIYEFVKTI